MRPGRVGVGGKGANCQACNRVVTHLRTTVSMRWMFCTLVPAGRLDERMVDLVDQLWAYLIAGCEELQRGRDFATYFPDQPLELRIRHVGGELLITTSVDAAKKAVVQADEFFAEVSTQGRAYLSWLERNAAGGSEYRSLVERATRLYPANAARR